MKVSVGLFLLFMVLSSVMPTNKDKCVSYIEQRFYYNGKVVNIQHRNHYWQIVPKGVQYNLDGKYIKADSLYTVIIQP